MNHLRELGRSVAHGWEAIQVELRGQYSLARYDELRRFSGTTGILRALSIAIATPMSCLATIVGISAIPLRPPYSGLANQTYAYWLFTFASMAVVSATVIIQFSFASALLPRPPIRILGITLVLGAGATLIALVIHKLLGFPAPFFCQVIALPWQTTLFTSMWFLWRQTIRQHTSVQSDLKQYASTFGSQCIMIAIYPLATYLFSTLSGLQQTLVSFCLPVLKLLLKNVSSHGMYRLEDLAPTYVVLSVDVFHALFLACAMQSATTRGTIIAVMSVDIFQSCVAVFEIYGVLTKMREWANVTTFPRLSSASSGVLSYTNSALAADLHIRDDPLIGKPRREREQPHQLPWREVARRITSFTQVAPFQPGGPPKTLLTNSVSKRGLSPQLHSRTTTKRPCVEYVRLTLKILHMVEFYVLIEYTEVVVPFVYSIYLTAMLYLPNRAYNYSLKHLTDEQLEAKITHLVQYALLELVSLVALLLGLDRLLHFSTLRLLAFTLQKHALLAQSLLVLWVFFPIQMTLDHLGNDYTFRFEWLHKNQTAKGL